MKTNKKIIVLLSLMLVIFVGTYNAYAADDSAIKNNSTLFTNSSQETVKSNNDQRFIENSALVYKAPTRNNAPTLPPAEPGATCVPVPEGIYLLLTMVLLYGFIVVCKTRRKQVKTNIC